MRNAVKGIRGAAAAMGLAILVQGLGTLAAGPLADAGTSPVTATARVHVRSGPSTSSSSLAVLSVGDSLPSKGSSNGWTKVTYKGKTAYVYSQYLKGSSSNSGSVSDSAAKGTRYATANLNLRTGAVSATPCRGSREGHETHTDRQGQRQLRAGDLQRQDALGVAQLPVREHAEHRLLPSEGDGAEARHDGADDPHDLDERVREPRRCTQGHHL
ncbi:MAG: SH3 domain-containing protein [Tessaracoccus sp.]|nr:SH3 domain-containing protein [Tessaracoccus sp.]